MERNGKTVHHGCGGGRKWEVSRFSERRKSWAHWWTAKSGRKSSLPVQGWPGAGERVAQAAPLRRRPLAELGSYMALGVNVSLSFQVPNWRSYFSHWFFLPPLQAYWLWDFLSSPYSQLSSPLLKTIICPMNPKEPRLPHIPALLPWTRLSNDPRSSQRFVGQNWYTGTSSRFPDKGLMIRTVSQAPLSLPLSPTVIHDRPCVTQAELWRQLPSASGKTWSEPANWGFPGLDFKNLTLSNMKITYILGSFYFSYTP